MPVWENPGERPDDGLIARGYAKLDVPASAHFNYILNQISKNLNEIQTSFIDRRAGLMNAGQPTFNSEFSNFYKSANFKLINLLKGWYRLTNSTNSALNTVDFTFYNNQWNNNAPFVSSTTEYSLIFSIRTTDEAGNPTVEVMGSPKGLQVKEIIQGETVADGTTNITTVQVVFTTPVKTNNLECQFKVVLSSSSTVTRVDLSAPYTIFGRFFSGRVLSTEGYARFTQDTFKYLGESTDELVGSAVEDKKANKFGAFSVDTSKLTNKAGLPENSIVSIANISSLLPKEYDQNSVGQALARIAIAQPKTGGSPQFFVQSVLFGETVSEFEKMLSVDELEVVLRDYVRVDGLDTLLSKYATKTDLDSYVKKDDTIYWQKSKITKDNGDVLVELYDSNITTLDTRIRSAVGILSNGMVGGVGSSFITISTDITTLGLPSIYLGTSDKSTGYINTYTSGNAKMTGTLIMNRHNANVLVGTLIGRAGNVAGSQQFLGSPFTIDITIDLAKPATDPSYVTVANKVDLYSTRNLIQNSIDNTIPTLEALMRKAVIGDTLWSGTASSPGSAMKLSNTLGDYDYLGVQFSNGTMDEFIQIPLYSLRLSSSSISIQSQNIKDDGKEVWLFEFVLTSSDGTAYQGNQLTIKHNNRFTVSTNASASGSFCTVKKIIGYRKES